MKDGRCECNDHVEGSRCERCERGYFGVSKNGCTKCWCRGLTNECTTYVAYWDDVSCWMGRMNLEYDNII